MFLGWLAGSAEILSESATAHSTAMRVAAIAAFAVAAGHVQASWLESPGLDT